VGSGDQYADLAAEYHWLYDPRFLRVGTRTPGVQARIRQLPAGAHVLDAACGIGIDTLSLHRRGFDVVAADGSAAMVDRCRERLAAEGVAVPVVRCAWADLPNRFGAAFDAVLCTGNSLAHAASAGARRAALSGFAQVLVADGTLILDSQDWRAVHALGPRHDDDPLVVSRDGVQCRRAFDWRVPDRFGEPLEVEITLTLRGDEGEHRSTHELVFTPFSTDELVADLEASGFQDVEVRQDPDDDRQAVAARRSR